MSVSVVAVDGLDGGQGQLNFHGCQYPRCFGSGQWQVVIALEEVAVLAAADKSLVSGYQGCF